MRPLLGMLLLILTACGESTAPPLDLCYHPGDTIAVLRKHDPATGLVVECTYGMATTTACYTTPVFRVTKDDCIVGKPKP